MVNPVLRGEVRGQTSLPKLPPVHVVLHLAALSVRPAKGVQAGEIGVIGQAGADPAQKEHYHLGLGAVGFQADAVEEVDEPG